MTRRTEPAPTRAATITTPAPREVRIERIFDAPREDVWRAMTDPALVAQWWGRGHKLVIERMEVERGGHWRFVEHAPHGVFGFEGRYREVTPPSRVVQTFEWDGMPGHVAIETITLEDLGDGRTRVVTESQFMTDQERDGMLKSGMEQGLNQSYAALDALLARMANGELAASAAGASGADAAAAGGNGTNASAAGAHGASAERGGTPKHAVKKVAFTMYPATDVARARRFYEETLGLAVGMTGAHGEKFWVEYDLPGGGCVALTNTTGERPGGSGGGTIALEVADLTGTMQRLRARGVQFKTDTIRGPHCTMAVCVDSEGNSLLLHQLDAGH